MNLTSILKLPSKSTLLGPALKIQIQGPEHLHLIHGYCPGLETFNPRFLFPTVLGLKVTHPHFADGKTEVQSRKRTQSSCRILMKFQ